MRLEQVTVSKLFGLFDHVIPLRNVERTTILYGPNGIGKTIVLRMIAGLMGGELALFRRVPFTNFTLRFDDGSSLSIAPNALPKKGAKPVPRELVTTYESPGGKRESASTSLQPMTLPRARMIADRVDELVPLTRVGPTSWEDYNGEELSLDELISRYRHHLSQIAEIELDEPPPPWLLELRKKLPPVRLIETQRLQERMAEGTPRPRLGRFVPALPEATAARYSRDLAQRISDALKQYAARAQELDRTFPTRLIAHKPNGVEPEKLRARLAELEAKRTRLTELGFLDEEQEQNQPAAQALVDKRDVLTIYANDVEQKLATFDLLADRIELFLRIINQRFEYKTVSIQRERGFVITQSGTNAILSPVELSSGEQHELVLLYDLLFRLQAHSLVLIDEPEISLHVTWQQTFLQDLQQVVQLSDVDVVIATHAPEIISERWRVVVPMEGLKPSKSISATS